MEARDARATTTTNADAVVRRINRRIALAVSAFANTSAIGAIARKANGKANEERGGGARRARATKALVWLHGFADESGAAWDEFANAIVRDIDEVVVLTPDAPLTKPGALREREGAEDVEVRAWFEPRLRNSPGRASATSEWTCDGMEASVARVRAIVDETCETHGIARSHVILGGFSQGACLALACAASPSGDVGGVLALRGYLPNRIDRMGMRQRTMPNALILAGGNDPLVPVEWSIEAGAVTGARVVFNEDVGHELCADDVYRARLWIAERFAR